MSGRNATAARCSENISGRQRAEDLDGQSALSDDVNQMKVDHFPVSSNMVELSTSDCNNNSVLKCDLAERSHISADGGDVSRPRDLRAREDTDSASVGLGSKEGRSWGQCPLCPFVCPHPLVMRRHLDVHDEPELLRSTDRRPTDVGFSAAAVSTSKASVERGAAGTGGSLFDVTGNVKSYFDGAERASRTSVAMLNCPTWSSTFARWSDGTGAGKLTDSTPGWLKDCPSSAYDLRSTAGNSASWNSTSVSTVKSAGQQTAPGQAVVPFPCSLQAPSKTEEDLRRATRDWQQLYECPRRSERARCSKGGKKHAAKVLPAGGDVLTLAASAPNTTMPPWWNVAAPTGQWRVPLPPTTSTGSVDWLRGWASNEQLWNTFVGGFPTAVENSETAVAAVRTVHSTPTLRMPSSTHVHGADFKVASFRYYCTTITWE